jgi:PAS domain S-box-containing protein
VDGAVLVVVDINDLKEATERVRVSEIRFRRLFETTHNGVLIVNSASGKITEANPFITELLGYTHEELLGKELWQIGLLKDEAASQAASRELQQAGFIRYEDLPLQAESGETREVAIIASRHEESGEQVIQYNISDISDRKRAELRLHAALHEKEVLLKEIHHRVKNNLQIVSSLLNLQSDASQDPKVHALFEESRNRIKSIALVHETLYSTQNLATIDMATYTQNLIDQLRGLYGGGIVIEIRAEEIVFDIDTAMHCGLILNELISNAMKHAFPLGKGRILVEITSEKESRVLVVQDDGIGLPADIDPATAASLGLRLVVALVRQLGGTLQFDRGHGTRVAARFAPAQAGSGERT